MIGLQGLTPRHSEIAMDCDADWRPNPIQIRTSPAWGTCQAASANVSSRALVAKIGKHSPPLKAPESVDSDFSVPKRHCSILLRCENGSRTCVGIESQRRGLRS